MNLITLINIFLLVDTTVAYPNGKIRQRDNELTSDWAGAVVKMPPPNEGGFVTVEGSM